jgi:hypothetical protein
MMRSVDSIYLSVSFEDEIQTGSREGTDGRGTPVGSRRGRLLSAVLARISHRPSPRGNGERPGCEEDGGFATQA